MSPGQTGHITGQMGRVPGTDGTHTRGCPAKILYVYWFFSFPIFKRENGPLKDYGGKRPIKVGKRPMKAGKRPIEVNGLFWGTPPEWKTAPLKRPIKRSMMRETPKSLFFFNRNFSVRMAQGTRQVLADVPWTAKAGTRV